MLLFALHDGRLVYSSTYRSNDFQCDLISDNGRVSVGDVSKRTGVYEYRGSLNSLYIIDDDDDDNNRGKVS